MTAEIVVMNKSAVALAADSAVTIQNITGQKIYNTVNKLFSLSKYHPVGIMIYGSADFMGISWETVIKVYRKQLGTQSFNSLNDYAEDFVSFLDKKNSFIPEDYQEAIYSFKVELYFRAIAKGIQDRVTKSLEQQNELSEEEIISISQEVVLQHWSEWDKAESLPHLPKNIPQRLRARFGKMVTQLIEKVFQSLPLPVQSKEYLSAIAYALFYKSRFPVNSHSGIVIAGFGEQDIFPSTRAFQVENLLLNRLKYSSDAGSDVVISHATPAAIIPFAQKEMVLLFIQGFDPGYGSFLEGHLTTLFQELPDALLPAPITSEIEAAKKMLIEAADKIKDQLFQQLREYSLRRNIRPVIEMVGFLPKDELSAMAESLVNLTSFKRKISMEPETVGGPIDVAVISKGDGFTWIKRKHYFEKDLNQHFFANYFREKNDEAPARKTRRRTK